MNTIPAIGSPGSLVRRFQEQPELGVELLEACEAVWESWSGDECINDPDWGGYRVLQKVRAAIAKARQEARDE